jgi:single-strand DNA-binding protein
MAEDINSVTLVGRLTRDAELKYTNTGMAITHFAIAVNRTRKDGDQWVDEANFFDVNLWGKRGESLNQYLQKGTQVAVLGELRQERWEKDGQKNSRVSIHCNNIQLLSRANQGQATSNYQGGNSNQGFNKSQGNQGNSNFQPNNNKPSYESYPSGIQGGSGNFEDDIPF